MSTESENERRSSFVLIDFTPEVEQQCLKQVEFYFSEYNFPFDKFLRKTAEQNDGWVPITTIASFNRMKRFRPVDKVVESLRKSTILEVSNDGENVKRKNPLNLQNKQTRAERTVVIMNFESLDADTSELQEKLEKFFQSFGKINQVRLKKDHKKKFNGTVFVEFNNEDDAKNILKQYVDDSEILSFESRKLNVLSKKQYDLQREVTRSKNFSGTGQRSRSFTGYRKNMPKELKKLEKKIKETSNDEKEVPNDENVLE